MLIKIDDMEPNFSIGTYSISENGISVNYTCPSILPKEMADKFSIDTLEVGTMEEKKEGAAFDDLLKGY